MCAFSSRRLVAFALGALALLGLASAPAALATESPRTVRFATFNASLNRYAEGQLVAELSTPEDPQIRNVAEIIQRVRPDVLLLNEFDHDERGAATRLFQDNYLSVGQGGARSMRYRYRYAAPSNTGLPSGFDLNNAGGVVTTPGAPGYGEDAFGFGAFPGQFGMAVYSRFPIERDDVRTFQRFLWRDMPGALLPDDPATATPATGDFYSEEELAVFRLSSKSHWDLPLRIGGERVHFLVSHPTPPVFDGPEDRNGRRNHDEIRFWSDYVTPGRGDYVYDDEGARGGLADGERFVIAGDQNADPFDGDSVAAAVQLLLGNPRVNAKVTPDSDGAIEASARQRGANERHRNNPAFDTADFADGAPGNLRTDYVLPSRSLSIANAFVFWPGQQDPLFRLVGEFSAERLPDGNGFPSSDHRLVALDLRVTRR